MEHTLRVSMLGVFSLDFGDSHIDDQNNRMCKVWLLLAYMIYNRRSRCTQEQYLSLLQGGGGAEDSHDPSGRMKALFYRARAMLDQLYEGAGHRLILRKNGSYCWDSNAETLLDVELFDALRTAPADDPEQRLKHLLDALALYRGDFLPKLSMEAWVMPISAYYHQAFLDSALEALALLEERARWQEAEALCRHGLSIEPYSESLYQHLMRCCLARGERNAVLTVYEQMSELLFDTFGVMPSEESRALSREAARQTNDKDISICTVRDQLKEPGQAKGAMFCEYDFFRLLYQVQARAIPRTGDMIHIALLTVHGPEHRVLSRKSLDLAVANLKDLIQPNLRQGDVVSQCSVSQLVIMLPQANYENSCAVCQRLIKAFDRKYPHSPARIRYAVHLLEPMTQDDK